MGSLVLDFNIKHSMNFNSTEVQQSLYHLFSTHGQVLDVVAKRGDKSRGQAFVVFREVPDATAAMRALQGFPFLGKAIVS
jgi:U2 small nuclear ribonucleoprotein B''